MVQQLLKAAGLALCLSLAGAGTGLAQDYEKGLAAYNSGDYATALREWRLLAEEGETHQSADTPRRIVLPLCRFQPAIVGSKDGRHLRLVFS